MGKIQQFQRFLFNTELKLILNYLVSLLTGGKKAFYIPIA